MKTYMNDALLQESLDVIDRMLKKYHALAECKDSGAKQGDENNG